MNGFSRHYVLAAGGTGGHMVPAHALAEELLARGHRVALITDDRGARIPGLFDKVQVHVLPAGRLAGGPLGWLRAARSIMTGRAMALRLYESGHRALLHPQPLSLAMTIRRAVAQDPGRSWSSAGIEEMAGLSGPTLRRRLAGESTSLRAVIADARIAEALRLLMTSRLPVKAVAARVGYSSVASFSRQFTERYGTEPSGFR